MTKKEFILQGFTTRTHLEALREMLDIPDIQQVTLSVAFVGESGVRAIEERVTECAANVTVFAGIRNDITSYQGLIRLLSIANSSLYTVDTGARRLLFHPKLYFVRGEAQAGLMVGSANLTLGGLNNNIEASIVLKFDLTNAEDKAFVDSVDTLLSNLMTAYPSHIAKVRSISELDDLLLSGRIVDEAAFPPPRQITTTMGANSNDTIPRIKLKVRPMSRASAIIRAAQQTVQVPRSMISNLPAQTPAPEAIGAEFELVWESKPLTRRDLTIPDEIKTHATGSINLDKGLLPEDVDHRHYFRDYVFVNLVWARRSTTVDEAFAKFQLIVKGIRYGEFDLDIRYTNSTTSRAYHQRNAMTRLSWGPVREYVARPDLIGRTLTLSRDKADPKRFVLEID